MIKKVILPVLLFFCASVAYSQNMKLFSQKKERKIVKAVSLLKHCGKYHKENGKCLFVDKVRTPPKKIGLVSFYVFDPYDQVYHYSETSKHSIQNHIAAKLMESSFSGIKEGFKAYDMELLAPSEFLDTEEKQRKYSDLSTGQGGEVKQTDKMLAYFQEHTDEAATPAGILLFPAHYAIKQHEVEWKLYEFMKETGLDAVLIVAHEVVGDNRSLLLRYTHMIFYGENSTDLEQAQAISHLPQEPVYNAAILEFKKGIQLCKLKDEMIVKEGYQGYDRFMRIFSTKLAKNLLE